MSWELSYMNAPAFTRRLFLLRMVRQELRVNPRMRMENLVLPLDCGIASPAIPIVRDWRLPPYVCVLVDLVSGARKVLVFAPDPATLTAE